MRCLLVEKYFLWPEQKFLRMNIFMKSFTWRAGKCIFSIFLIRKRTNLFNLCIFLYYSDGDPSGWTAAGVCHWYCSSSIIVWTWLWACFWALKPDANTPDTPSLIMLRSLLCHEFISFMQRSYIILIAACRETLKRGMDTDNYRNTSIVCASGEKFSYPLTL